MHYIGGRFLTHENYFGLRYKVPDSSSGFDSIQCWKSDVEQNEIRFQLSRFLNRFQSIGHFANNLQFAPFFQRRADELPKGREVFDDQDAN